MPISKLKEFLRLEAAGGIMLLAAAVLAMIAENSPAKGLYGTLLSVKVSIQVGDFAIAKPLLLWINDGLMALFFFLVGLEIKREVVAGELAQPSRIVLPALAALGGMAVPALIYAVINRADPVAIQGWAIPSATDIAFALGVLALLGSRVPQSLKLFLMTLAIIDDLGAIVIIAVFYAHDLSSISLIVAGAGVAVLYVLNRRGVLEVAPYALVGLIVWVAVLKSGIHATLAGVIVAFFIPFRRLPGEKQTQLEKLEHDLHPSVAFGILPLFAFANAGISFAGLTLDSLLHPVPLGIAAGLFVGNQVGVLGLSWLAIRLGIAPMPAGVSWPQMYGVSLLCGIGFTMSLFVSSLAFDPNTAGFAVDDRLGILLGSLLSGVAGYLVLRLSSGKGAA